MTISRDVAGRGGDDEEHYDGVGREWLVESGLIAAGGARADSGLADGMPDPLEVQGPGAGGKAPAWAGSAGGCSDGCAGCGCGKAQGSGVIALPWPARELSPNARVHWAKKSKAAKAYRRTCHLLTKADGVVAPEGAVLLLLEFCPPDRRRRDDDNCLAAFKSGRDGLADALGIDDGRFVTQIRMGEPVQGGAVMVRIQGEVTA